MDTSETSPVVRHATLTDARTIAAFNQAMAAETEGITLDPAAVGDGVRRALGNPRLGTYYLAEVDGTVVGQTMVTTEWSDWRNGFFWWIQSVYVAPEHRGQGVFRALYEHIHKLAQSRHEIRGLRLYVRRDNRRAINTYRGLGMSPTDYVFLETE